MYTLRDFAGITLLFLCLLNGNGILYNKDGTKRIADNTLVVLTLMIAESRAEEKDRIIKVIVSLINKNNLLFLPFFYHWSLFFLRVYIRRLDLARGFC